MLEVAIDAPLSRLFDYLPPATAGAVLPGCRVQVPFGRRSVTGMVMGAASHSELPREKLRRVQAVLDDVPLLFDADLKLIRFVADYYHHPIGEVVAAALPAPLRKGRPLYPVLQQITVTDDGERCDASTIGRRAPKQAELLQLLQDAGSIPATELDEQMPGWRRVLPGLAGKGFATIRELQETDASPDEPCERVAGPSLNDEQRSAVDSIRAGEGFCVSLLDGVTGSGKTEVYLRVIERVLEAGRQVLLLVPEIGLTPQLVVRLEQRLGITPALLHSALADNARLDAWRRARNGSAPLIVGTRSALFVPLKNPGLIIVDEEHDASLKQQEGLRYSARDLAVVRGKHEDIPIVLGSATPSLESLQRCRDGAYSHLRLPHRAGSATPPLLRLVDISASNLNDGLSQTVIDAMREELQSGGQVLLFLNRRGYAPTLICTACGQIAECERCDARMTVHAGSAQLRCHHCGAIRPLDSQCVTCGGACLPLGHGTERLEDAIAAQFPGYELARIDSDSTRLKGTMTRALARATEGRTQILVGTQMLSKGHHFPKLSMVAVVNADQGLFSTDFRGGERLAQSLVQVAGRAGRERRQGQVIVQTAFPKHPFWNELFSGGYERVAEAALAERQKTAWPPFSKIALLRAAAHKRDDTHRFLQDARRHAERAGVAGVRILGPVSAPMERLAGRYRGQLLMQSVNRRELHELLRPLRATLEGMPSARKVRWSIDVDPIELF
ncbi:MAG: primosomal protein N' [Gammaproteobacteria bacterium]|nr:primosomal protein N' [Gammaproteobacteria bacterium]